MSTPSTPELGALALLRPWLLETPAPTDRALRYARAVKALTDTLTARLDAPTAEIVERMHTHDHSNETWVRKDGHYVATAIAGTQRVLDTVADATTLLKAGCTAATWAVLDLAGEHLRRLLALTEVWEEGSDFPHTAASTQALTDLQRASADRGLAFTVPAQHQDYLSQHPQPTSSWDTTLLPQPAAAATLNTLRAGTAVARSTITIDTTTRPDLTPAQHTAADTTTGQQRLQATLAIDLAALATTALCGLISNHVDTYWETWIPEIDLAARITTNCLDPQD